MEIIPDKIVINFVQFKSPRIVDLFKLPVIAGISVIKLIIVLRNTLSHAFLQSLQYSPNVKSHSVSDHKKESISLPLFVTIFSILK